MTLKEILSIGSVALTFSLTLFQQSASADILKGANGCFPRVFSQIDQFKMSSGGLRNTHSNPRSIVCSIDNDTLGTSATSITSAYIHVEELPADMDCSLVTRTSNGGALVDSVATTLFAGDSGDQFVGDVTWDDGVTSFYSDFEIYNYIQCKVPGDGRVFGYEVYFNDPEV